MEGGAGVLAQGRVYRAGEAEMYHGDDMGNLYLGYK